MLKNISKLGASLSKTEQKEVNGGAISLPSCGGDGSFIYQDDVKVCCYQPGNYGEGTYIC